MNNYLICAQLVRAAIDTNATPTIHHVVSLLLDLASYITAYELN